MYIFGRLENDLYKYDNYRDAIQDREKITVYKKGTWLLLEPIFSDSGIASRCIIVGINDNIDDPKDDSIKCASVKNMRICCADYLSTNTCSISENWLDPRPELCLSNITLMKGDVDLKKALFNISNIISKYNLQQENEE